MRLRLLLPPLIAAVLAAVLLALSGTAASADTIPDPATPGTHTVTKLEYYGGSVMMSAPASSGASTASFQQPLDGALFYPNDGPGPFDVVILLHGNHADCLTATGSETTPSSANCASTPGNTPLLNYEGYDYLAQNLASHGFIVLSLDADALTSWQTGTDDGTALREQLISSSLDMVYAWEDGAPLYQQTSPGQVEATPTLAPSPYALAGKIDLENGVGIWGHSRGGEGVTDFVEYNRNRPSPGKKYKLDAVMAWAPVDYIRASVYGTASNGTTPAPIAYADVLPLCDGDVSDIHGARDFMNSLYPTAEPNDPSPKIQFGFQGGDHDYTNTLWASSTSEDGMGYDSTNLSGTTRADAACGEDEPNNIRLTPQDQQHLTVALTSAFMQRYVQGNMAFDPLMTGAATLPAADTGQTRGVAPDEELKTDYWAPANQRLNVLQPQPENLTSNLLGGALTGTGFEDPYQPSYCAPVNGVKTCEAAGTPDPGTTPEGFDWCDPEPVDFKVSSGFPTAAKSCPLPPAGQSNVYDPVAFGGQANERENDPANRSWGPQLALAWDGPAELDNQIPSADSNVSNYKVLAMDAAVNYFDSRNPPSGPNNPLAETDPRAAVQDFLVQVTDAEGDTALVHANNMNYGTALEAPLGSSRRNIVLSEIRIPLTDFTGIDLTKVTKVSLIFGTQATTVSGSIELANMRFEEAVNAPTTDPVIGAAPSTGPQGTVVGSGATGSTPASAAPLKSNSAASSVPTDAVPIDGTDLVPTTKSCVDRTAPDAHLHTLSYVKGVLKVGGWATDKGCTGTDGRKSVAGSVLRVLVSVAKVKGKACEFLTDARKLHAYTPCAEDYSLVATGKLHYRLKIKANLPSGTYILRVQALDKAGNLQAVHSRRITIKNGKLA